MQPGSRSDDANRVNHVAGPAHAETAPVSRTHPADRPSSPAATPTPAQRTAETVLVGTARTAGWLARQGWQVARRFRAGEVAQRQLLRIEDALITELHRAEHTVAAELRRRRELSGATTPGFAWRTSIVLDPAVTDGAEQLTEQITLVRPLNGHAEPLRAGMAELLGRSAVAGTEQSRGYLYAAILRQLLPDEARMLAALADGKPRPVVNVTSRNSLGGTPRTVLENASTVGRDAGVTVTEHIPFHLTRLHRLGLVDIGPEDGELADQYAILIADDLVRTAVQDAKHVKLIRRAAVLSAFGERFWTACDPLS